MMFRIEITRADFEEMMGIAVHPEAARMTITSPFNGHPIIEFVLIDICVDSEKHAFSNEKGIKTLAEIAALEHIFSLK